MQCARYEEQRECDWHECPGEHTGWPQLPDRMTVRPSVIGKEQRRCCISAAGAGVLAAV
jgi:hypothetical protein